ncbi:MAG: nitroreductase family protein [Bacteroidales bacterium]|nr:nitroreductase family protein [Bacteroidales bacterium]
MISFLNLAELRQSDRKYSDIPVETEKLERCLEAARLAPSASNSQPWTFVAVNKNPLLNEVAKATVGPLNSFNNFVTQAPIIVAIVMEKPKMLTEWGGHVKKKEYPLIDIGIAAEHFCLQAAEDGLGTCMLGWFDEQKVKDLLSVPDEKNIPLLITLGYTPEGYKHRRKIRKSFDKTVHYNGYGKR